MTDIMIVGGGPAGLTAAIYAARAGKSVVVCEKESLGGQITQAHRVRNYPGFTDIAGIELGDAFCAHAMDAGARIEFTTVQSLAQKSDGSFAVQTDDGTLFAIAVIYAGGARPRLLEADSETEMVGKGISYCALCDGEFYRDQDVAVVGGGNTAVSDTMFLAEICRSVTLIHRRNNFRAGKTDMEILRNMQNVRILTPYTVQKICGEECVRELLLSDAETGESTVLTVSALFVALGRVAYCGLIEGMADLDEQGYVITKSDCSAKTPGLYAAGDCRAKDIRQLTTAASDGTIAGIAACNYVDRFKRGL